MGLSSEVRGMGCHSGVVTSSRQSRPVMVRARTTDDEGVHCGRDVLSEEAQITGSFRLMSGDFCLSNPDDVVVFVGGAVVVVLTVKVTVVSSFCRLLLSMRE